MNGPTEYPLEISVTEARQLLENQPDGTLLLDVREPVEWQICNVKDSRLIPMREIPSRLPELPRDRHILAFCHHGIRSLHVTQYLRANGFARVSNVAGGIEAWAENIDPAMPRY